MTKYQTIKQAFNQQNEEKQKTCRHVFVDGYEAATGEVYKRCVNCGLEKDRREMSMEDAEKYLGVMTKLNARGDRKRREEQIQIPLPIGHEE